MRGIVETRLSDLTGGRENLISKKVTFLFKKNNNNDKNKWNEYELKILLHI